MAHALPCGSPVNNIVVSGRPVDILTMHMGIDHAWSNCTVRQVNHFRSFWAGKIFSYSSNPISFYQNLHIWLQSLLDTIKQFPTLDQFAITHSNTSFSQLNCLNIHFIHGNSLNYSNNFILCLNYMLFFYNCEIFIKYSYI